MVSGSSESIDSDSGLGKEDDYTAIEASSNGPSHIEDDSDVMPERSSSYGAPTASYREYRRNAITDIPSKEQCAQLSCLYDELYDNLGRRKTATNAATDDGPEDGELAESHRADPALQRPPLGESIWPHIFGEAFNEGF